MSLQALEGQKYVSVTTYRRNREGVPTPVWFIVRNGHVYVWTEAASGKVKRIRINPKVALAPCKMDGKPIGPYFDGVASISQDDSSSDLRKAFKSKYGLVLSLSRAFSRGKDRKQVFLEITPS